MLFCTARCPASAPDPDLTPGTYRRSFLPRTSHLARVALSLLRPMPSLLQTCWHETRIRSQTCFLPARRPASDATGIRYQTRTAINASLACCRHETTEKQHNNRFCFLLPERRDEQKVRKERERKPTLDPTSLLVHDFCIIKHEPRVYRVPCPDCVLSCRLPDSLCS